MSKSLQSSKYIIVPKEISSILPEISPHILCDTDSIVSAIAYDATKLFDDFRNKGITLTIVNHIYIELMNTNNPKERIDRQKVINDNEMVELNYKTEVDSLVKRLQITLHKYACFPSPIDLYIGAVAAQYEASKVHILTGNIKDFPAPVFDRVGYIIMQNDKSIKAISILKPNASKIDKLLPD